MDDLISRQAALDAFGLSEKTRKWGGDHSGYDARMLYEIQDVLEDLPSVNPQKTGRWIEVTDEETLTTRTYHYECSECGSHLKAVEKTRYCSECGALLLVDAKMQEE